ncbi:CDPK-related kinase 3, partial [Cucurbita argyrosperma subsp. argyrosperma]
MGQCYGKTIPTTDNHVAPTTITTTASPTSATRYGGDPSHFTSGSAGGNGVVNVNTTMPATPARTSYPSPWPSPYPHGVSAHPWLRDDSRRLPLDILIYKLVKLYLHATPFRRAAMKALSKALTENELFYLRAQFALLEPNQDGRVGLDNFKVALMRNATDAMRESRVQEIVNLVCFFTPDTFFSC